LAIPRDKPLFFPSTERQSRKILFSTNKQDLRNVGSLGSHFGGKKR
jgi:hypothetical protein